jgi:hypothetical protein
MAPLFVSKAKKRGSERRNSMIETRRVTIRRVPSFSLSIKRRTNAPRSGKKTSSDKIGMPRIDMNMAPYQLYIRATASRRHTKSTLTGSSNPHAPEERHPLPLPPPSEGEGERGGRSGPSQKKNDLVM